MKMSVVFAAVVLGATPVAAADSLSVGKCLEVLTGLMALDRSDDGKSTKQYKFSGSARLTMALDIVELRRVSETTDKLRLGIVSGLNERVSGALTDTAREVERAKATVEYLDALEAPCSVQLGRLKLSDLRVGDSGDENQIPPSVLASILPIVDR